MIAHLEQYSSLWSLRWSTDHVVFLSEIGGWTAIGLPDDVHPWQLHNMASWMLDCPQLDETGSMGNLTASVIAESGPAPHHPGYRLVRDPALAGALCGWDDSGMGWTVSVPTNDIVVTDELPVPKVLRVPTGHTGRIAVSVRLEDPGCGLNPGNVPTVKTRRQLHRQAALLAA